MQAAVADRHNFGQQVKPTEGASCSGAPIYYQKPRTVFWEWLFFGSSSPLQPLFATRGKNSGLPMSEAIFNLDVLPKSEWSGSSREIVSFDQGGDAGKSALQHRLFVRYGMLLGYAYVFGIRDLHHSNLVRTKTNLQVIDAEVVLTDLVLPHETLLLPFKDVAWKDCGLSLLANSADSITEAQRHAIMSGYIDVLDVTDRRRDEILSVMNALDLNHPIRIILRNTSEYAAFLKSDGSYESLLDGERIQLARKDIPYFFKRLGAGDVFWVTSVEDDGTHEFTTLTSESVHAADIARHAVRPEQLLTSAVSNEDRLEVRLLRGVMYLRKHIGGTGQFNWRDKQLNVALDSISFGLHKFSDVAK